MSDTEKVRFIFSLVDFDRKRGGHTFRNFRYVVSEVFGFTCWTVGSEASSSCSGSGAPPGAPAGVDQSSTGWSNASLLFWLHFSGFHLIIYNVLRLSYRFCEFSVGLIISSQNRLMLGAEAGSGFTVFFYTVNSSWLFLNVPHR